MEYFTSMSLGKEFPQIDINSVNSWITNELFSFISKEVSESSRAFFSIQNEDIEWPTDFIPLLYWTVIIGAAHQFMKNFVLMPIAKKFVIEENAPKSKKTISTKEKFVISTWRFITYLLLVFYGIYVMHEMGWFTDPSQWFRNWPNIHMEHSLKLYYWISFGNYLYASIIMFFEIKQKDFMQMICHHATTLGLLWTSYTMGFHRVGTVILLLHDSSDPLLEVAKSFLYIGSKTTANILFSIFAVVFCVTRLVLFPFFVIYNCWVYGRPCISNTLTLFFVVMLLTLQALHIFWAKLIYKVAEEAWKGDLKGDIRDKDHKVE